MGDDTQQYALPSERGDPNRPYRERVRRSFGETRKSTILSTWLKNTSQRTLVVPSNPGWPDPALDGLATDLTLTFLRQPTAFEGTDAPGTAPRAQRVFFLFFDSEATAQDSLWSPFAARHRHLMKLRRK